MTGASYAGGDAVKRTDPVSTPAHFDVQRFNKDGVEGWILLREGVEYEFWPEAEARRIGRKLLFSHN